MKLFWTFKFVGYETSFAYVCFSGFCLKARLNFSIVTIQRMRFQISIWTLLQLAGGCPSEFVDPNCPWVPSYRFIFAIPRWNVYRKCYAFSDYDLSLICISKCDDVFLNCIAGCSDSECVLKCNRDSVDCNEGDFIFEYWNSKNKSLFSACPCHTDCLEGCNGCENPICFCNVSEWKLSANLWYVPYHSYSGRHERR